MKRLIWIALAVLIASLHPVMVSCDFFEDREPVECTLVELEKNESSRYYDAVVRVESLTLSQATANRFTLVTPTGSYNMGDLEYLVAGKDPEVLESKDVFVVPLRKPDWKFYIREQNEIYGSLDFWELIPEADRWHPLKSEAMEVAQSIELTELDGILKPTARVLPGEWYLEYDEPPAPGGNCGTRVFQKIRVDEMKEEVSIEYCKLTAEERKQLKTASEVEFLQDWTAWTREFGQPGTVAGHTAVYWDMEGTGYFGWSYRYVYIDRDTIININIDSDPEEWVKTEQEKEEERRTRSVIITYDYGPVGEPEWDISIVIRANGEGSFDKLSSKGISITKLFELTGTELSEIKSALLDNNFLEMESHSGEPGDTYSSMTVTYDDIWWMVDMWNDGTEPYQKIEQVIREIVLPRVGEE